MTDLAETIINKWEDVVKAARADFAVAIEGDDWLGSSIVTLRKSQLRRRCDCKNLTR